MERPALEVADIFRDFGPAWRDANRGHVSHAQLKVMSAIEVCRTAALGGYVARCENAQCAHTVISYCSCRNRHCPKCQSSQALTWMEERKAELLQIPYFHIVFTLPAEIGAIAYQNKHAIYALLFKAASDTMLTIAADPKHLGAKIAITAVLHTWGSAMTQIVTGGGISPDGSRWIASRPDYLVPVEVLSSLFRGRMLGMLSKAHATGHLEFFGDYQHLADTAAFKAYLGPLWKTDWFVYAKRPFAGPEQVLAYLSRYTHRVAISNSRLISADQSGVTFKYKDYRLEGPERYKTMTLEPGEFIRRFLLHVLPKGFHRMRHPGRKARPCSPTHRRRSECRFTTARRSARNLRCDNPSLPALRQPHGDHRHVRGASQLSPSTLNAVLNTPHQHLMTLHAPITRACGLGLRRS